MTFKQFFNYMSVCSIICTTIATVISVIGLVAYGKWANKNDSKNLEAEKTQNLN